MKRFYCLLMALVCFTFGQTLYAQCGSTTQTSTFNFGGTIGSVSGANCGTVEITEFALIAPPAGGGSGTPTDPYITPFSIKTCVDVLTFDEQTLNWLHSVMLNNQTDLPAGTSVLLNSGEQQTAGAAAGNPSGAFWRFVPVAYGAEPDPSTWPTMIQGTSGDGFEPFPGFYVDGGGTEVGNGDGDTANNFGDSGDGNSGGSIATTPGGVGLSIEDYTLAPFCFQIDVANDGSSAVQSFRPQFNLAGDGSTGNWTVPTFGCILASQIPTMCGPANDGRMYYASSADAEVDCGTATQTSTFDFGGTVGSISGSSCGVMEITELGLASGSSPMGSGTAQDPYITPFELKTCVDVKTFDENVLNWLHSVLLNNQTDLPAGTSVAATGTGVQATAGEKADPTDNGGATNWIFNPVAYGAEPDPSTWPTMVQGTSGDGFEPFPGYYADGGTAEGATTGDGDSANNFGDSGNGASGANAPVSTTGALLGSETFDLDPFCFSIMVGNDGTEDVKRFRPQFNMAGDGSTGNWTVPTFECLLAAFIPTSCGPNDDGSVYYASAVDPETDCGTMNEVTSADLGAGIVTGAACGHMEVTEMGLVGTNAGSGTDADPYIVPFSVKTCVDVKTFDESLVNWLHSVFIRNRSELPDGTTITATGTGAQPTAAETLDAATNTGASEWIFVDVPTEPAMATWATMIQGADGDGFHPYSGYYCDGGTGAGEADGDSRNSLGDNGNGQSGEGAATPAGLLLGDETYTLEPFCFLITVAEDVDTPGGKFRPNFGMAGDGSTGAWTVPTLDCLLANYFPTECGPNNDGTFAYTTSCPSSFTVALNNDDNDVFGGDAILSGTGAISWDVTCADASYLNRGGADATDLVADMLWYDNRDDDNGFAPGCAPADFTVDVSCETESTNPTNGFTGTLDCSASAIATTPALANQITCKSQSFPGNSAYSHELIPQFFDILCATTNNYNVPNGAGVEDDCTSDKMTFYFPVYDYDRNAGANNTVPSLNGDYHPDCDVVRDDVVVLPVQPTAGTPVGGGNCIAPMVDLVAGDGTSICDTKEMTMTNCDGPTSTATWDYTWTAQAISTIYTNEITYSGAYSDVDAVQTTTTCNCAILLSEFMAFDAKQQGRVNLLEWATASEENTKWHIIERSENGRDFEEIGRQNAQGNSSEIYRYSFEDKNPFVTSYYRIRSVDFDEKENMTDIRVVQRKNDFELNVTRIFPNPTSNIAKIEFDAYKTEKVNIVVMDIFGKVIAQDVMETENSKNVYNLDASNFDNGVYMIAIDNGVNIVTKRLIKQ